MYYLRYAEDSMECPDICGYPTLRSAVQHYRWTAEELHKYGQECEATVHKARVRDEMAEYPDYALWLGPRGGVRVDRL